MKDKREIIEEGRKAAVAWYTNKSINSTNPYEKDSEYDLWEDGWAIGVKQYMNSSKEKK